MTQVLDANNRIVPVTVVKAGPCVVTQVRTRRSRRLLRRPARLSARSTRARSTSRCRALRKSRRDAAPPPRRAAHRRRRATTTLGQEFGRGRFRGRPVGRRGGHHQGQRHRRCHEAPRLQRRVGASHGSQRNHRKPGSIGGCSRPAGCSRACGWPAGWVSTAAPRRTSRCIAGRRREGPAADQGRRPRPQGRPRARPYRSEGSRSDDHSPVTSTSTPAGAERDPALGRAAGRGLRRAGQHRR